MTRWIIKTARGRLDLGVAGIVWKRFARYARPHALALVGVLTAAIGAVAMQLAAPVPIKLIFDHVLIRNEADSLLGTWLSRLNGGPETALALACGAILVIAVLEALCAHVRDIGLAQIGQKVVGTLRRDLFAHIQSLPPGLLERRRTGDLLMRLTGDVQMLRQMLVDAVVTVAQSSLTVVAMVVAMFWLNPVLGALAVATIPLTAWAGWSVSRKIRRASKSQREKESTVASIAHDALGALPVIQAFNRQAVEQKRFARENRSTVRAGVKTTRLESKLFRFVTIASAAATCVILFVGVRAVLRNIMTAGDLLVFLAYLRSLHKPMRHLTKVGGQLAKSTSCGERIAEIFGLRSDVCDAEDSFELDHVTGAIRFEGVSFAYPDGTPALKEIDAEIEPGERVAIVGHNGAGKSTLIKLLLRFMDPQHGTVRIDGRDIRTVKMTSLRRALGWVHQDTILFGMSIAENIAFGRPNADMDRIRATARQVDIDAFVRDLPETYDTVLGQNGCTLSGGQRQRIALARALLHDPSILLLDEPATGLDPLSSRAIESAWMSPDRPRTTLVICHRLRNMDRFGRILVMRDGRIVESGTHADLTARDGEYTRLIGGSAAGEDAPEAQEAAVCP